MSKQFGTNDQEMDYLFRRFLAESRGIQVRNKVKEALADLSAFLLNSDEGGSEYLLISSHGEDKVYDLSKISLLETVRVIYEAISGNSPIVYVSKGPGRPEEFEYVLHRPQGYLSPKERSKLNDYQYDAYSVFSGLVNSLVLSKESLPWNADLSDLMEEIHGRVSSILYRPRVDYPGDQDLLRRDLEELKGLLSKLRNRYPIFYSSIELSLKGSIPEFWDQVSPE